MMKSESADPCELCGECHVERDNLSKGCIKHLKARRNLWKKAARSNYHELWSHEKEYNGWLSGENWKLQRKVKELRGELKKQKGHKPKKQNHRLGGRQ